MCKAKNSMRLSKARFDQLARKANIRTVTQLRAVRHVMCFKKNFRQTLQLMV